MTIIGFKCAQKTIRKMVETKNFKKNIIWTGKNHKKLLLKTSRLSVTVKKA